MPVIKERIKKQRKKMYEEINFFVQIQTLPKREVPLWKGKINENILQWMIKKKC